MTAGVTWCTELQFSWSPLGRGPPPSTGLLNLPLCPLLGWYKPRRGPPDRHHGAGCSHSGYTGALWPDPPAPGEPPPPPLCQAPAPLALTHGTETLLAPALPTVLATEVPAGKSAGK